MLGKRIAALRRQKRMSQQELARAIAVSASAVGMYEQGRREPPLDRLLAIAELFGVSTDYLLTGVPHTQADTQAAASFLRTLRCRVSALHPLSRDYELQQRLTALLEA